MLTIPALSDLAGRHFDVVVIGAGINGASAAQHLAAAGYDVLAVDKGDFASGSTSRSSRLLHCGLRYLAPGRSLFDFVAHPSRLVTALTMARSAMQARAEFVATAPARAAPMRLAFPLYRDGPYRGWQLDLAFACLHGLAPAGPPLDYERLKPTEAFERPLLRELRDPEGLTGVVQFREYQLDWPERVAIDALLDATRLGAVVRNYTRARLVAPAAAGGWCVALADADEPTSEIEVTAARVLNLAGAWIDDVNRTGARDAAARVTATKGAHIVVRLEDEIGRTGIATLNSRGAPFYCLPWRGLHYFGPTETLHVGESDRVAATGEDVDFLLAEANRLLPRRRFARRDVLSTWAGVRPLTFHPAQPMGQRDRVLHDLARDGLPGVFALTGGPVMTHRSAGRLLAARAGRDLKPRRAAQAPSYGSSRRPEPEEASMPGREGCSGLTVTDLADAARAEAPRGLADLLFRRTGIAWERPLAREELARAAESVAPVFGWSRAEREEAIAGFEREQALLFGVPDAVDHRPALMCPTIPERPPVAVHAIPSAMEPTE